MRSPHKLAVVLLAIVLLTTACGARLTSDQKAQALTQSGGNGAVVGGPGGAAGDAGTTGAPVAGTTGAATTGGTTGAGTTGGRAGTTGGTGGTTGTAGTGGSTGGTGGGGVDTRAAPPGGNGGATDKGVTEKEIVLSNVSDISGAVPGLFEDAQLAAKAYVAYFTAREGTIYGRKLKFLPLDSRLDSGANRAASLEACDKSFASVGSVSAFDQGGAPVIKDCGIPDLRGLSTTDLMKTVPNAFPINAAGTGGSRSMAVFGWAKDRFPTAVKKAAYIYIDGEVTRQLSEQDIAGAEATLGFDFVYQGAIGITETNYGPTVQKLKSSGAQYVTFVGAYQQAAALAQEFKRQSFKPQVFQPTVTAYAPDFIKQAGDAAEGVYVAVSPSLNEEIGGNQELTTYAQWLRQVNPKATPTGIGQYAWAAAALFVEKAKKIGPKLTRKALLAELPGIRGYTGNGLFPAQDVGGRKITSCTQIVQVRGGKFVRVEPPAPRALRCVDPIYNTKTKKAEKGFPR